MFLKKVTLYKYMVTSIIIFILGFQSYGATTDSMKEKYKQLYKMKETVNLGDWFHGEHIQRVFEQSIIKNNLYRLYNMNEKLRNSIKEQSVELTNELDKKTPKNLNEPGVIFNSVQTYTLIYMLALIHIVAEDNAIRNIDPDMLGRPETTENLLNAGYELLVSGEMISSLFAAGATHRLFKVPLEKFNEIVTNKAIAPLVKNLIISFSNSLVSFTGWEFGAQLWKEAINMLDYQLAGEIEKKYLDEKNRLIVNAFKIISHGKGRAETKEVIAARKILSQTFQNMLYILTLGSDGNIQWLYNTLRHRLLNGHFVSLILSMGSASAIGSTYLPLLAPLLSTFGIGIAGGLASIYLIPEEQKHSITTFLRSQKMELLNSWEKNATTLYLNAGFDETENKKNEKTYVSKVRPEITFEDIMLDRVSFREKIIENYIDQIHYYYNQIINDNDLLVSLYEFIERGNETNQKAIKKMQELVKKNIKNSEALFENLEKIILFYMAEAQNFDTLKDKPINESVSGYLDLEKISMESMASHFCSISQSLLYVDFIKDKKGSPSNTSLNGSISRVSKMCNFEVPSPLFNYTDLGFFQKRLYDSSVFFLQQANKGRYNETKLIIDRTRVLTQMFSSP